MVHAGFSVRLMRLWLIALFFAPMGVESLACSTVMLKQDGILLTGHNLDESVDFDGFVCVNKRDMYKVGSTWNGLKTYSTYLPYSLNWISRYGSVTWSSLGRDLPDAGVNEAGLVIEEMSLSDHPYPPPGIQPRLFQMQWIQYHLDSFSTVAQVTESASLILPDGWPWHFFVADRQGDCATLEYIDNRLVVHTGQTLPVTALCNDTYQAELRKLSRYQGFGGSRALNLDDGSAPRFVRAAHLLNAYDAEAQPSAVTYVFDILENLSSHMTRRSYVVDLIHDVVYFRTASHRAIRRVSLRSLDFSCETPVQILDLNAKLSGDVTGRFENYSTEANRSIAESWVNHAIDMYPDATIKEGIEAGFTSEHVDRYAGYPALSLARADLNTDKNRYGLSRLFWAAYLGDLQEVRALVEDGADTNVTTGIGTTPLMAAAQTGRLDVMKHLVRSGATMDLADRRGTTALVTAIAFGQSPIAAYLIEAGADVRRTNKAGCGALHYAAASGDLDTVKLLVAQGSDPEAKSDLGWTALISAAFSGRRDLAKHFISTGADLAAVDVYGNTPLLVALMLKHSDIAEDLIAAGADVLVQNNGGQTAWSLASAAGHHSTMERLAEAGARPPGKILPVVTAAVIIVVLVLLMYRAVRKKRQRLRLPSAVAQGPARSASTVVKRAAVVLSVLQVVVGVLFLAMKGLPKESMEWVLLAMWFVVPGMNLAALILLGQKQG